MLLAVPNVSEGRDTDRIEAIGGSFGSARLLDVHSDPDHNRTVFTLAAPQGELAAALLGGARAAIELIDLTGRPGVHPRVGAIDVVPVVYTGEADRGPACAEALTAAALIGEELGLPVFLYGALASRPEQVERADIRRGGPAELARRIREGDLVPDHGPAAAHPTAGAALVTARPPLVAFNIDLASGDLELARRIAAGLRESGGGLPGVRAIGLELHERGVVQVSMNVQDHCAVPLRVLVERVGAQADIAAAELVGLAPRAAFEGFPPDVPLRGFDPERHLLEEALRSLR